MGKLLKKEKGITLIALVITIVILIVLAGVLISITIGQNGILSKAKIATSETKKQQSAEKILYKLATIKVDCTKNEEEYNIAKIAEVLENDDEIIVVDYYYNGEILEAIEIMLKEDNENTFKIDAEGIIAYNKKQGDFAIRITETTDTAITVEVNASNLSNIVNYTYVAEIDEDNKVEVDNISETTYTITGLTSATEYTVYVIAHDSSSKNIESYRKVITTSVDSSELANIITITPSKSTWTDDDITVSVDYGTNIGSAVKEISTDGGSTFTTYNGAETISTNTTVVARLTLNGVTATKNLPITWIDKLEPNAFTPTISDNTSNTQLVVNISNVTDANATEEYAKSNIKDYKYYIYNGETLVDSSSLITNTSWTGSGLSVGTSYRIYVEAYDNAGNVKKSNEVNYTKLTVYTWDKYNYTSNTTYSYSRVEENKYARYGGLRHDKYYFCVNNLSSAFNSTTGKWTSTSKEHFYVTSGATVSNMNDVLVGLIIMCYDNGENRDLRPAYSNETSYTSNNLVLIRSVDEVVTNNRAEILVDTYRSSSTTTYNRTGSSLGTVTSSNASAYPANGYQSGYYYVKR